MPRLSRFAEMFNKQRRACGGRHSNNTTVTFIDKACKVNSVTRQQGQYPYLALHFVKATFGQLLKAHLFSAYQHV